jgi:glycosyltransferase involved in cell wall biosynthesis
MQYSVIIPAHNESSNIETQVTRFIKELPPEAVEILHEIIIVENGSTDGTLAVCRHLEKKFSNLVRVCTLPVGSYGEAIKLGMLESTGTHLSILECDFLDIGFVMRSVAIFRAERAELIVASKRHPESIDRRPIKRRVLTAIYNLVFLRLLMHYPGTDTHGLKSIEARCAKRLCHTAITTDEVFQTEIVLLAWRLGVTIEEIPISISELRTAPISIRRRAPKVLNTVQELKRSLIRFPLGASEGVPVDVPRRGREVEPTVEKSGVR